MQGGNFMHWGGGGEWEVRGTGGTGGGAHTTTTCFVEETGPLPPPELPVSEEDAVFALWRLPI